MIEEKKYKLLTTIRYFGDACFYPFFSLYLKSAGLVESRIGFILSITPIISIIINPIYSFLCKNLKQTKKILEIITIVEAFIITLIGFSSDFYIISILTILLAIFGSCHYGLLDSITVVFASSNNVDFSKIRIYGSIAYIIATSLGGIVIDVIGYRTSFIIAASLFILSGLIYHVIKPLEISHNKQEEKGSYKEVITNKKLILLLIFYTLLNSTNYSVDSFLSVFFSSLGVSSGQYGFIYSYYVVFEVITLLILPKLHKKPKSEILFIIASILFSTRLLSYYLQLNIFWIVLFTSFKGIVNGIILYTFYTTVLEIVGKKNTTIAILLFNLVHAIYIAIGNNIFGKLIETNGYKDLHLVGFIISLLALLLSIIRLIISFKENNKTTSPDS